MKVIYVETSSCELREIKTKCSQILECPEGQAEESELDSVGKRKALEIFEQGSGITPF